MTRAPASAVAARLPGHVVYRRFAAETVLLNLDAGTYHGLNLTGGRMLEVLEEVGRLDTAVTVLAGEFEQPVEVIEKDLRELCSSLAERGLLELDRAPE